MSSSACSCNLPLQCTFNKNQNQTNFCLIINLKKELDAMNIEINNTRNRKEHFTEYGMIPIKINPIETIVEDKNLLL